jgi:hypothetical protein
MEKIVELLEAAIKEAASVDVLGIWDREHLNNTTSYIKQALSGLKSLDKEEI